MPKHLPFNALRVFESAARHLSFSLAADELHVTPSAVSQQVRSLEQLLGTQLFHRANRSLSLTPAGEAGLDKLREGFDNLAEALSQIARADEHARPARVAAWMGPGFASKWLVPRLPRFTAAHPGIDLAISASTDLIDSSQAQSALSSFSAESFRRKQVDLAIRFGKGHYPGCHADKLFDVHAVALCSPRLLQGEHALRQPADLVHHTLLHDETAYEGRPHWAHWLAAAGVEHINAEHGLHFNGASLALEAAADGQGVVLSLAPLASDDLLTGKLVIPFNIRLPLDFAYHLIRAQDSQMRPEVACLRTWLLDEAARYKSEEHTQQHVSTALDAA